MRKALLVASAAFLALSASAYAQDAVIVEDPGITGSTTVLPGEVRTYVLEQSVPSVRYEQEVLVGEPLPEAVEVYPVEGHDDYAYTIVNERRVIVNPQTRTVIQVLE
ncbi:MAG: DUF1236 domain-containing protein [Shinella sp.]|nr:DUF1236 domain-containing protein [Shinella sp.]